MKSKFLDFFLYKFIAYSSTNHLQKFKLGLMLSFVDRQPSQFLNCKILRWMIFFRRIFVFSMQILFDTCSKYFWYMRYFFSMNMHDVMHDVMFMEKITFFYLTFLVKIKLKNSINRSVCFLVVVVAVNNSNLLLDILW